MNFSALVEKVNALNLNIYDLCVITDEGSFTHRFHPSNACNNSYSVAKAFVVTAIGLLVDDGLLNTDASVYSLLKEYIPAERAAHFQNATIEHVIQHTLGFAEGFLDIDVENVLTYKTNDYLSLVLNHPTPYRPGEYYQYSDAAYYLLSRIISLVSGKKLDEILNERIIQPLSFHEIAWSRCPKGYPIGATGLYARAEDIAKLGWLYLNNGLYHGRQLLSSAFVEQALKNRYEFRPLFDPQFIGKLGMYGQGVAFSPSAHVALAWHAYEKGERMHAFFQALKDEIA